MDGVHLCVQVRRLGSGYAGDGGFGWIWMKGQLTSVACRRWKDSTRLRVTSKHSKQAQHAPQRRKTAKSISGQPARVCGG